jgi:hypothetical protein
MELEIKGFIEFCKFLANYPEDIAKNEELVKLLDFCFNSISTCNCSDPNKNNSKEIESSFFSTLDSMSKETHFLIGNIFDKENKYTNIYISFVNNDTIIKIK